MPIPRKNEKIIIVGAGVYGLSTALAFLEDGYEDVHVFDKNDYVRQGYSYFNGCDSASSDMNKIFRCAYGEQTHYTKLSFESQARFLEWNRMIREEGFEDGSPVYYNTGNVHLTDQRELPPFEKATMESMPEQSICVADSDAAARAEAAGLSSVAVDPFGVRARGAHLQGLLDTAGGIIVADKMCRWVLLLCQRAGGPQFVAHFGATEGTVKRLLEVPGSRPGSKKCVGIETVDGAQHFAPLVAVFGGSWTAQIVPEAGEKVEATGGTVALIKIDDAATRAKYDMKTFPTWTYKVRDGMMGGLYGFPVRDGYMKIGYRGAKWTNPVGKVNSKTKTAYTAEKETNVPLLGLQLIKNFIRENIPEISKISMTRLCWYSDTEDNDFLISYCPYYEDNSLFVGCGDSGHAFMMFGSLGRVIKSIILQRGDNFLTNLFSWTRVREKLNIINGGTDDPRALCNLKMASEKDWLIYPNKL